MATYVYSTNFKLDYPVKDMDAAQDYLEEDDMTKYLVDDIKYDGAKVDLEPEMIQSIEWKLKRDDSGVIELRTNVELNNHQLDYISDWVSGQNSDGLGEGFEQQDFATIYDEFEDEDGETYDDYAGMASFDWQTNDYKFKLERKIGVTEGAREEKLQNSVLVVHFTIDPKYTSPVKKESAKEWFEGLEIGGFTKYLKKFSKKDIKKAAIEMYLPDGFYFTVYTTKDLEKIDPEMVEDIELAVTKYVADEIEPYFQDSPVGQIVTKREIKPNTRLDYYETESKKSMGRFCIDDNFAGCRKKVAKKAKLKARRLSESTEPTEKAPLKIEAPRGEYWVWQTGDTIYGSAKKPDPTKNIVNAREITDFTSQGFDDLDEVIAYVKKYF